MAVRYGFIPSVTVISDARRKSVRCDDTVCRGLLPLFVKRRPVWHF